RPDAGDPRRPLHHRDGHTGTRQGDPAGQAADPGSGDHNPGFHRPHPSQLATRATASSITKWLTNQVSTRRSRSSTTPRPEPETTNDASKSDEYAARRIVCPEWTNTDPASTQGNGGRPGTASTVPGRLVSDNCPAILTGRNGIRQRST